MNSISAHPIIIKRDLSPYEFELGDYLVAKDLLSCSINLINKEEIKGLPEFNLFFYVDKSIYYSIPLDVYFQSRQFGIDPYQNWNFRVGGLENGRTRVKGTFDGDKIDMYIDDKDSQFAKYIDGKKFRKNDADFNILINNSVKMLKEKWSKDIEREYMKTFNRDKEYYKRHVR